MNTTVALDLFSRSQDQLLETLQDVPHERWAEQPGGAETGVRNHPAWTVPHLCAGHGFACSLLGIDTPMPESWGPAVSPGTIPVAELSAYPDPEQSLAVYREGHAVIAKAVEKASADSWDTQLPVEAYRAFFPTIGHAVGYFLYIHEPHHLAQVVVWKRAAGLVSE